MHHNLEPAFTTGLSIFEKSCAYCGARFRVLASRLPHHHEPEDYSCPECGKMTRIGHRIDGGRKVRICRKCEGVVDK